METDRNSPREVNLFLWIPQILDNEFGEDDSGVKDASPEELILPGLSLAEVPDLLGPMVLCANLFRSVCLDPLPASWNEQHCYPAVMTVTFL